MNRPKINEVDYRARAELLRKRQFVKKKKFGKPPIWKYPKSAEIRYRIWLLRLVEKAKGYVKALFPHLERIISERDAEHHIDAWPDSLDSLLHTLRQGFNDTFNPYTVDTQLTDIGQYTSKWNDRQWQSTLVKVLGVDVYRSEKHIPSMLKSFVNENATLITKLKEETYHDVARIINVGVRQGDRIEQIKKDLLSDSDLEPGRFRKVETRAELIARDQIGKLNGELTETRQKGLGIEKYIWHTSQDERVCEQCEPMEGLMCNWDDDSVYSDDDGDTWQQRTSDMAERNPGECHPQDRCWAEPVFEEEEGEAD
jgi:SPP1 gp7 family putative phage head morphogenesis protein